MIGESWACLFSKEEAMTRKSQKYRGVNRWEKSLGK